MPNWSNWSGRLRAKPTTLSFVRSEADAAAIAAQAANAQETLRVAGSGHSHADLITNGDHIVDCSGLNGVVTVDASR